MTMARATPSAPLARAVVTGGSSGIGLTIVRRLLEDGYRVLSIDRQPPPDRPAGLDFHQADLLVEAQALAAADAVGRADAQLLVNDAAVVRPGACDVASVEDLRVSMALNLEIPQRLMQAALPAMKARGMGRVVNIASRAALGKPLRAAYSASKAGLIGMTRTWALELGEFGITANCVAPGPIATDMFRKGNPPDSPLTKGLMQAVPVRRMGTPEDVAHAVAYLADPRTGFVTGQTLYVCGGLSVGGYAF